MFWTCMFCNVDCQLLLTCLQHRVVSFVLCPIQAVLSMTVNHVHHMFSKTYIERSCQLAQRKSTMHISCYITIHHLYQVLRAKDGYMSSLFIEMKMIHWIISDESSRQHTICHQQLFRVVTWKHFSQFTCILWQKGLMWVHLHSTTYQTDMV